MADSAFKVLVLPRGEQADISQFGAELQKICDQVNTAKVKVQADPTAITDSLKAALSSVKLDVQFNASSIETSIKTALTGKTFDINVNPVVQQGNSGGSAGSTGNSGGQQRQPRQQQIGQRDTFAKIVASEAYLEGLRKKLKVAEYKGNDQSAYKAQIETYSKGLSDRKVQFAANNNTTVAELDKVIKQTDRFTKAQAETAAASEKARLAWDAQVAEASDLTKQMDEASTRIKTLQSYEGKDSKNRAGLLTQLVNQPLMNNLVKTITEKNDDKTETKRTGLLPDYETRLTKLKTLVEQIKTPEFKSDTIENQRAKINELNRAYVEASAQGIDRSSELADIKSKISAQERKIADKEEEIASIQETIDSGLAQQQEINAECAFKNFFTNAELTTLDRYFKQDAISESSFVYKKVSSYADPDIGSTVPSVSIALTGAQISGAKLQSGRLVYSAIGGNLEVATGDIKVSAKVVRSTLEQKGDGKFIYSAYLNKGSYNDVSFESAGITVAGTSITVSTDVKQDEEVGGEHYVEGTYFTANCGESSFFFTRNCSEYEKRSIEWDLLEYGQQELTDLCWPSYSFSVDVGNFLVLDDFVAFKNQFALGDKVYINLGDKILTPIAIGVEVNFEKLSDFKLLFGDKYSLKDSAFKLVDLLEESIKMGKSTASSKVSYSSFIDSGASTYVKDFMDSALDAAKNAVLAGANQEIKIEESGIRLRSYDNDSGTYGDEQIWMINNTIAFTDDNWSSAKMAIGKIFDNNLARYEKTKDTSRDTSKTYYVDTGGTEWNPNGATAWSRDFYEKVHEGSAYGIAAPYLVGTVIAGSNLIIVSAKQDSGKAVFRVDADGAKLYNSRFDLAKDLSEGGTNDTGLISLNPGIGFVGGKNTTTAPLFSYDKQGNVNGVVLADGTVKQDLMSLNKDNLPRPNFWIDMLGNAYLKGTIYATDGVFSGELKAATGDFSGTVKASKFVGTMDMSAGDLIGPNIYVPSKSEPKFKVDGKTGKVTITDGSISFSSLDQTTKDNISSANTAATEAKAAAAGAQATADAANGLAGSANIAADNAVKKVNGWAYGGTTYIDGAQIMTGTVMASKLLGGSVGLIAPTTNGEMTVGSMDIVYTNDNTQYGLGITSAYGGIQIVSASNTNIFLSAGSGSAITMSGGKVKLSGALCLGATYGTASPKSQGISGDYGQIYVQYV